MPAAARPRRPLPGRRHVRRQTSPRRAPRVSLRRGFGYRNGVILDLLGGLIGGGASARSQLVLGLLLSVGLGAAFAASQWASPGAYWPVFAVGCAVQGVVLGLTVGFVRWLRRTGRDGPAAIRSIEVWLGVLLAGHAGALIAFACGTWGQADPENTSLWLLVAFGAALLLGAVGVCGYDVTRRRSAPSSGPP